MAAFESSLSLGFGIETDIRDQDRRLVIAHDLPEPTALGAGELFEAYSRNGQLLTLAINIKADGLQNLLKSELNKYELNDYFVFDMSVPDAIASIQAGLNVFSRQSDIEPTPVLYSKATGIWLDAFYDDQWITPKVIEQHLLARKKVCIVSPELHGRCHMPLWEKLKKNSFSSDDQLLICTDFPEAAKTFFQNEK